MEYKGLENAGSGMFAFIKNLQGDIVSITPLDSESNVEVNMEYDAWGKPIFKQASSPAEAFMTVMIMAATNVAYRGYFYDFDTGLYYLRSRYYDPETGRFINADDIKMMIPQKPSNMTVLINNYSNLNTFSYCQNNPQNNEDCKGTKSKSSTKNKAWGDFYLAIVLLLSYEITKVIFSKTKGAILVNFEYYDKETKTSFYEIIDYYNKNFYGNIFDYIAKGVLQKFKDNYSIFSQKINRDFLYSEKCVSYEIKAHYAGYMWACGKEGYVVPTSMYVYGVLSKGSAKSVVKGACSSADIYENDAKDFTGEAICFNYFDGVRPKYRKTKYDPFYYRELGIRIPKVYPNWEYLVF